MLKQYIMRNRNGKRQKVGMFFGTTLRDEIVIGYSLCCPQDKFDKDKALAIAVGRALSPHVNPCPPSIYADAIRFAERCERYFKDAHLVYVEDTNEA